MKKIIAISTACALLSACGGGGGGGGGGDNTTQNDDKLGPAVALSTANYQTATAEVLGTVLTLQSSTEMAGDLLTGTQVERLPNQVIQDLPNKLNQWAQLLKTPSLLTGAVLNETLRCGYSGTIALAVSDVNENDELDAGDRILVTYNQCKEDVYNTVSGEMNITVNFMKTDGAYPQKTDISATITNLISSAPDTSLQQDGSFRIEVTQNNPEQVSTRLDVLFMHTSETQASRTVLYQTKNFVLNTDEDYSTYVLKANGNVSAPTLGSNTANLNTLLPFTFNNYGQQVARSGELLIAFKDNSKVRVKATGTSSAELALDLNGDGVYEERKLVPWSDLL